MRWHLETWRKLYVRCSPSWLRLSVSARGLGTELLKYCDDRGKIDIGEESPGVAVAYLLGARPREHRRIAEDVTELLRDGYLTSEEPGIIAIRNFVQAQDRTPGAKRTAAWRASREQPERVTCDVTGDADVTSRGDAQETSPVQSSVTTFRSDPFRSVPTRSEERDPSTPTVAPAPATETAPAVAVARPRKRAPTKAKPTEPPHPRHGEVVDAYFAAFEARRGSRPTFGARDGAAVKALLQQCAGDADRAIAVVRGAYSGDPWLADRATIASIASDPSKYLGRAGGSGSGLQRNLQAYVPTGTYDGGGFVDT